jgi:hypothetical protein
MSLKAYGGPADTITVRAGHPLPAAVDRVLTGLPSNYVVAVHGEARFVAGTAAAFVLLPTPTRGPALAEAAHTVRQLAERTRGGLCDHLAWVPFLDTLLVSSNRFVRRSDVTVAPVDLLAVVLTEGPPVIDRASLGAIRSAVLRRRLGDWRMAPERDPHGQDRLEVAADARIDLCDRITADTIEATISRS